MIRTAACALALLVSTNLGVARAQDPTTRGSHEARPAPHSAGLTMEMLNGLPRTRTAGPSFRPYYVQPYPAYSPSYSFNSAYSYPHPNGLGGYYPPGAGGYYGSWGGWGGGGWGGWFW